MESYRNRLVAFAFLVLLFFGLVIYRLVQFQWIEGEKYLHFSQVNTLREISIPAPRGRILDRQGRVLAENRPSFVLSINLSQVKDVEKSLKTLAYLLGWDEATVRDNISDKKNLPHFTPIVVAQDLGREEVARLRSKMTRLNVEMPEGYDLTGIELTVRYERVYPYKEKVGHVMGYVREVSDKELAEWQEREPERVGPGDKVGVAGVEKTFDLQLRGYDGYRQAFVDAMGREMDLSELGLKETLKIKSAQAGENLQLTLDAHLMEVAYEAFGDKVGALVALDPRNGEILAMLSKPSYNPEELSGVISTSLWKSLQENPDKILLNRPLQAAYPPGSTFKIVAAVAGLAEGMTDFSERENCPGYYQLGGRRWGCWNKRGHGVVDLHKAIVQSCDVFFYKLGERLGPDRLARYANMFGLGKKTGILSDSEREGLVPTSEWKLKAKNERWLPSDSLGIAIGQGYDLVTPMQNALMVAQFANGGKKITPHLLLATQDSGGEKHPQPVDRPERLPWFINEKQFAEMKQALIDVVNAPGGTGGRARLPGIKVGGKTGTAQVVGESSKGKLAKGVKTGDHAWFVAFAPEDPEIAIAVIVEHAGHGGTEAAPIAQKVLAEYFKNRTSNIEH
jgi:penicillin-binding protein 2